MPNNALFMDMNPLKTSRVSFNALDNKLMRNAKHCVCNIIYPTKVWLLSFSLYPLLTDFSRNLALYFKILQVLRHSKKMITLAETVLLLAIQISNDNNIYNNTLVPPGEFIQMPLKHCNILIYQRTNNSIKQSLKP